MTNANVHKSIFNKPKREIASDKNMSTNIPIITWPEIQCGYTNSNRTTNLNAWTTTGNDIIQIHNKRHDESSGN